MEIGMKRTPEFAAESTPLMTSSTYKGFLDRQARACGQEMAAFLETIHQGPGFSERTQKVAAYDPDVEKIASKEENARAVEEIGRGQCEGDTITLGPYALSYSKQGSWIHESNSCLIEILPTSDKQDTHTLLGSIKQVEDRILSRGIAGGKINFTIGSPQPLINETRLADAIASQTLCRLHACQKSNRIMAVCASVGSKNTSEPVSLRGIILHEIGHILEPKLSKEKNRIGKSLEENPEAALRAFQMISPHYLAKQAPKIFENLRVLQEAKRAGKETVQVNGEPFPLHIYKSTLSEKCEEELFAEMVKCFYLEPAMHRSVPEPEMTGWKEFDDLQNILLREARYTLRKETSKEVFPLSRRTPTIRLWESVQDMLSH